MSKSLSDIFRGKKVFVTGHSGFKGSWLSLWLTQMGASVTGYSLPPETDPNNFESARIRGRLAAHHDADVRDYTRLADCLRACQPDAIFHLAAQALVRESYRTPAETFAVNVQGTVNLLEAVRTLAKPCAVVVVTSDKCYENREQTWGYRECDPLGGHDPYSASKGAAEIALASYRNSFFPPGKLEQHGIQLASARAGNVIGGGDWSRDRIVVDMVHSLRKGAPIPVRSPRSVRPWQHVLEPLSGYLLLAARMLEGLDPRLCSAWNFGPLPGEELPVAELVKLFLAAWGSGEWQDKSTSQAPHEANLLRLAVDKAIWELGWRPRWSVREAVTRTARWYLSFEPGLDMTPACLVDLRGYEAATQSPFQKPAIPLAA